MQHHLCDRFHPATVSNILQNGRDYTFFPYDQRLLGRSLISVYTCDRWPHAGFIVEQR